MALSHSANWLNGPVGCEANRCGGMAEWTKAVVLKTTVAVTSPGVRIPLPPPGGLRTKRNKRGEVA